MQMGVMRVSLMCMVLVSEPAFLTKERDHEVITDGFMKTFSTAGKKENRTLGIISESAKKVSKNLVPF